MVFLALTWMLQLAAPSPAMAVASVDCDMSVDAIVEAEPFKIVRTVVPCPLLDSGMMGPDCADGSPIATSLMGSTLCQTDWLAFVHVDDNPQVNSKSSSAEHTPPVAALAVAPEAWQLLPPVGVVSVERAIAVSQRRIDRHDTHPPWPS
jgi:hypothetical protein